MTTPQQRIVQGMWGGLGVGLAGALAGWFVWTCKVNELKEQWVGSSFSFGDPPPLPWWWLGSWTEDAVHVGLVLLVPVCVAAGALAGHLGRAGKS